MRTRLAIGALCVLALVAGTPLLAQQPPDPLGGTLFPPELVMQHQQAIGLSEAQRTSIVSGVQKAQARFTELQWQLHGEMGTMASLLQQARGDEHKILAQLDRVLAIEREIKRVHIALIVRIKNTLTLEQRGRLQEIMNKQRGK